MNTPNFHTSTHRNRGIYLRFIDKSLNAKSWKYNCFHVTGQDKCVQLQLIPFAVTRSLKYECTNSTSQYWNPVSGILSLQTISPLSQTTDSKWLFGKELLAISFTKHFEKYIIYNLWQELDILYLTLSLLFNY